MKQIVIAAAMSLFVVSLAAVASADTLVLRDGTRIEGTITGFAGRTITFRHTDGTSRRYSTNQLDSLEFFSADRANPRAGNRWFNNGRSRNNANNANNENSGFSANSRRLEAPAGTELVVRTVEMIDSRNAGANQVFSGIIEQAVTDASGRVIIPENSSAQLMIRNLSSGGVTGSPEMVLDIESITVSGRKYLVSTTDLTEDSDSGLGTNKRTGVAVGGGAAVGTIIGAIAGGGKGAVLGGVIGAAGGAATQVLTKGHNVTVPAETLLRFQLDKPVTLRTAQ
jgi:hypothetical protein